MDVHANSDRPEPLFRPVKKRKFVRRRADTEAEDVQLEAPPPAATDPSPRNQHSFSANDATQTAGIGRIRRPQRARRGGIEFSASSRLVGNERQLAVGPRTDDHEGEKIQAMRDRFTGHTGQTVDVDEHMYAFPLLLCRFASRYAAATNKIRMNYIESEMAKRYRHVPTDPPDFSMYHANETAGRQPPSELPQREPASLGKLHEIDLGQEAKLRNIARTEAATKRLTTDGEIVTSDQEAAPAPPTKDEKPRRNRKRRNSEDLERDRLVEEVLRESKCNRGPTVFCWRLSANRHPTLQWMFTMSPTRTIIPMTRLRTTRLLSNSGANSWMPSSHGAVLRARRTPSQPPRRKRQRALNSEVAVAPERQCGRCKRNQDRNKYGGFVAVIINGTPIRRAR